MTNANDIQPWIDGVIKSWKTSSTRLNCGISLAEIFVAETRLQFTFPSDFTDLYQRVDGFHDFEWNEHMFSFWSLDRIINEYKVAGDENFVGFCDFLISSHSIGFLKAGSAIYKDYDQQNPIAMTFREAVTMINDSADPVY